MSKGQISGNLVDQGQIELRQELLNEIDQFKQKIADYEQIQREINEISIIVNEPNSNRNSNQKQSKNSKASEVEPKNNQNIRRNTNKKIKIYDLRKKLDKYMMQQNQKKALLYQSQENLIKLGGIVQSINHEIEQQKKKTKSLLQLEKRILNDFCLQEEKVAAEIYQLEQTVKKKQTFNFQKRKIRDQLRKIRYAITKINRQRNNSCELELSITQSRGQLDVQEDKQILSENSNEINDTALWIGREKQRMEDFQNKVQISREKNGEMIEFFYNLKKKFSENEVLVKHHKITIKLLSNQSNNYKRLIQEAKAQIQNNNRKNQLIANQLKQVQGQRGYLRGKIGVIIQQERLIKSINILAENDVQNLRQKLRYLRNIKQMINCYK